MDQDVFSFDSEGEDCDALVWRELCFASLHMKGPGVPGADDTILFDPTLTQRPVTMRTHVIERGELSTDIRQAHGYAFSLGFFHGSRCRSLRQAAQLNPLRHMTSIAESMVTGWIRETLKC